MKKISTPHLCHAHCLFNWHVNTLGQLPHIDVDAEINSDKEFETSCLSCGNYENDKKLKLKLSELCKKYREYFNSLTLKEKIEILEYLPDKYGVVVLEEYAKLSQQDRQKLCDQDASDIKIQRFIVRHFTPFFKGNSAKIKSINELEGDLDQKKRAVKASLNILKNRPITKEFALACFDCFDVDEKKMCYTQATVKDLYPVLEDVEILNRYGDIGTDTDYGDLTPQEMEKRHQEYCLYTIGMYSYECVMTFFIKYIPSITPEMQANGFKNLINQLHDDKVIRKCCKQLFPLLSKEAQAECFDLVYKHLKEKKKAKYLVNFKDLLLQKKGMEYTIALVKELCYKPELFEAYKEDLKLEDLLTQIEKCDLETGIIHLTCLNTLPIEEKEKIYKKIEGLDLKIQKFVIENSRICSSDDIKEAAKLAYKLISQNSAIIIDFAKILLECLDNNDLDECVERCIKNNKYNNGDDNSKLIEFRELFILFSIYLPKLSTDKQELYLQKICDIAPSEKDKQTAIQRIFPVISPKVQVKIFDTYYPLLLNYQQCQILIRLKKQFIQNKKIEKLNFLVSNLKNTLEEMEKSRLLCAYGNKEERFPAFCKALTFAYGKTIAEDLVNACDSLTHNEQQPYLEKILEFVNKNKNSDDNFKSILKNLLDPELVENNNLFFAMYTLIQKNLKFCHERIKLFEDIFPKMITDDDKTHAFTAMFENLKIYEEETLEKWWDKLPEKDRSSIFEKYFISKNNELNFLEKFKHKLPMPTFYACATSIILNIYNEDERLKTFEKMKPLHGQLDTLKKLFESFDTKHKIELLQKYVEPGPIGFVNDWFTIEFPKNNVYSVWQRKTFVACWDYLSEETRLKTLNYCIENYSKFENTKIIEKLKAKLNQDTRDFYFSKLFETITDPDIKQKTFELCEKYLSEKQRLISFKVVFEKSNNTEKEKLLSKYNNSLPKELRDSCFAVILKNQSCSNSKSLLLNKFWDSLSREQQLCSIKEIFATCEPFFKGMLLQDLGNKMSQDLIDQYLPEAIEDSSIFPDNQCRLLATFWNKLSETLRSIVLEKFPKKTLLLEKFINQLPQTLKDACFSSIFTNQKEIDQQRSLLKKYWSNLSEQQRINSFNTLFNKCDHQDKEILLTDFESKILNKLLNWNRTEISDDKKKNWGILPEETPLEHLTKLFQKKLTGEQLSEQLNAFKPIISTKLWYTYFLEALDRATIPEYILKKNWGHIPKNKHHEAFEKVLTKADGLFHPNVMRTVAESLKSDVSSSYFGDMLSEKAMPAMAIAVLFDLIPESKQLLMLQNCFDKIEKDLSIDNPWGRKREVLDTLFKNKQLPKEHLNNYLNILINNKTDTTEKQTMIKELWDYLLPAQRQKFVKMVLDTHTSIKKSTPVSLLEKPVELLSPKAFLNNKVFANRPKNNSPIITPPTVTNPSDKKSIKTIESNPTIMRFSPRIRVLLSALFGGFTGGLLTYFGKTKFYKKNPGTSTLIGGLLSSTPGLLSTIGIQDKKACKTTTVWSTIASLASFAAVHKITTFFTQKNTFKGTNHE